jgi:hypothetical protein
MPDSRPGRAHGTSGERRRRSRGFALYLTAVVALAVALTVLLLTTVAQATHATRHDGKDHPGQLVAIPHFRTTSRSQSVAVRAANASAGTPSPPFRECPAIGDDQSCGILIYVTSSDATVLSDPSQGPYDGDDDTLVGVVNATSKALSGLSLSSNTDIFGFDGDGICTYSGWTGDSGCPYGPTGYEGPATQLIGNGGDSGSVVFTNTLKPGGVAYFSLENALTKANLSNPKGYVALGDSYSSGQGSESIKGKNWYSNPVKPCVRGAGGWPMLLGKDSDGSLVIKGTGLENSFFACSGATSGEIEYGSAKRPSQVNQLEQYRQKYGSPGLVTLTAGGDDVQFSKVLTACYLGGVVNIGQCTVALTGEIVYLTRWHKSFSNKLAALYSKVAAAAGAGSRVEVVGYPKIVPPWTSVFSAAWHCSWIRAEPDALVLANEMADDLNDDIRQAASQAHVDYASVSDAAAGHTMCTGDPWIVELSPYNYYVLDTAGHPSPPAQSSLASTVLNEMRDAGLPFVVKRAASSKHGQAVTNRRAHAGDARLPAPEPEGAVAADASAVPPTATVGYPYVGYLTVAGGTEPYSWSVTGGSLPEGLSLDAETGVISGETTSPGSVTFTVTATDSTEPTHATSSVKVTITSTAPSGLSVATKSLPTATIGRPYETTLESSGGTSPVAWSVESGSLPSGLSLDGESGVISGTPNTAGTSSVTLRAVDSAEPTAQIAEAKLRIVTLPESEPLKIATSELGTASQGGYYSAAITATGGTGPAEWSLTSGSLPAGVTLEDSNGVISGIPTEAGTFPVTIKVTDRATPSPHSVSASLSLTVAPGSKPHILTTSVATGEQGVGYYAGLSAAGGTGAYTWYITEGSLPPGVSLNSITGTIEGTPAEAGSFTFTATAYDSGTPAQAASETYSLKLAASAPTIEFAPSSATVGEPYEYTPSGHGGVEPYSWSLTAGELPPGLTLNPSTGTISGTPTTAGTTTLGISLSDSSEPGPQTTTASGTLRVEAAPKLQIISTEIPPAVIGQPYRGLILTTGGTPPLTWSVSSGSLPAGLSLDPETGVVSGTPSHEGTSKFTVQVVDSSSPTPQTQTAKLKLAVEAAPKLAVATQSLAEATAGSSYSANLVATGGTSPYMWSVASGSLPPGMSISPETGEISGTPTAAGEYSFVAKATDSSLPTPQTTTASLTIVVAAASPLTISSRSVPGGVQGTYYSDELDAYGGVAPYTWSLSSGALPAGLTLDPSSGSIYGQPKSYGTYSFTVSVSDSSTPEAETTGASYTLDIAPATPLSVQASSLPAGTQGQYYDQSLGVTGGVEPYAISVASGELPEGLYIDSYGEIYGEITSSQSQTFTVRIEDESSPTPQVITKQYTIQVTPAPPLEVVAAVAKFVVGQYGSDDLNASGGVPGYTYTVLSEKLPTGLYFSYGQIYGTPTKAGKGSLQVKVTDSATPTPHSVTKTINVSVGKPAKLKFATKKLPNATEGSYYDQQLEATGGSPGYTWSITAGKLPSGMYFDYGEIYGTPGESGTYSFTVRVTDSGGPTQQTAMKTFKLKVLKQ